MIKPIDSRVSMIIDTVTHGHQRSIKAKMVTKTKLSTLLTFLLIIFMAVCIFLDDIII